MFKKIISILLIASFLFPQAPVLLDETADECPPCEVCEVCPEPCDGQCLSDEVIQTLYVSIQELEHADSTNTKIIENLNEQIYIYIQSDSSYVSQIGDYKKQIELQEEMIKEIKPKWHENKYLWFGYGVLSMVVPIWVVGQVK